MTNSGSWGRYLIMVGLASLQACSGVTGDDYKGTPLAKLEGVMRSEIGGPNRDVAAAVVWMPGGKWFEEHRNGTLDNIADGAAIGTLVDVEGEFPASFGVTLYEPPPEVAFGGAAGEGDWRTAEGRIVAVDRTRIVDNGDGTVDVRDAIIGSSDQIDESFTTTQFRLWFVSQDLEDDLLPEFLTRQGYHLTRASGGALACDIFESVESCRAFMMKGFPWLSDEFLETYLS